VRELTEIEMATLRKLAEKALKELEEAYRRIPDTDNVKAYLFRGKERVRLMLDILKEG
jgi:flagellar motor switch protein FliM